MGKITVGKLRELDKNTPKEKIFEHEGLQIKLKTYLSILDKISFVSLIYNSAINDDEYGVLNRNSLDISFKVKFIETYTDIKLPENIIDSYNLLISTGLFDVVYDNLPLSEQIELSTVLDRYIEEKQEIYKRENSVGNIIKNAIDEILTKIPSGKELQKLIGEMGKEMKSFDPEKLKFVKDFVELNRGGNDDNSK